MAVGIADRVWAWLDVLASPVWALGVRNPATRRPVIGFTDL